MTLTAQATSSAPVEQLWGAVSDPTAWPDVLPTFTSVIPAGDSSNPLGPASRFDVRQPGLPRATYEVTQWVPGSSFTWVARSPGILTTATHLVSERAEGSQVHLSIEWTGVLAPLVRLLLRRRAAQMIALEATTLARVAEGPEPQA